MSRAPGVEQPPFDRFVLDCRTLFGDDLEGVFLYGSAAAGGFQPGRSDYNLAIVLRSTPAESLRRASRLLRRWRRWGLGAPLVLDRAIIRGGAQVFPIEFAEMKRGHRMLYGTDPFVDLSIGTGGLRAQCESELHARLLSLRQAYLRDAASAASTLRIAQESLKSFLIIMRNALTLLGESPPSSLPEALDRVEARWGLALPTWRRVLATRTAGARVRRAEIHPFFSAYLQEAEALVARFAAPLDREEPS